MKAIFPNWPYVALLPLFLMGFAGGVIRVSGITTQGQQILFSAKPITFSLGTVCAKLLSLKILLITILLLSIALFVTSVYLGIQSCQLLKNSKRSHLIRFGSVAVIGACSLAYGMISFRTLETIVRTKLYEPLLGAVPVQKGIADCGISEFGTWLEKINYALASLLGVAAFITIVFMAALALPETETPLTDGLRQLAKRQDRLFDLLLAGSGILILIVLFTGVELQWPIPDLAMEARVAGRLDALALMGFWGSAALLSLVFPFIATSLALGDSARYMTSNYLKGDEILRGYGLNFSLTYLVSRSLAGLGPLFSVPLIDFFVKLATS